MQNLDPSLLGIGIGSQISEWTRLKRIEENAILLLSGKAFCLPSW